MVDPIVLAGGSIIAGAATTALFKWGGSTFQNSQQKTIQDTATRIADERLHTMSTNIRAEIITEVARASKEAIEDKSRDLIDRILQMGKLLTAEMKNELNGRYANKEEFRELRKQVEDIPAEVRHSMRNELQSVLSSVSKELRHS